MGDVEHTAEDQTTFATKAEAQAWIDRYEADRCPCGGSPLWVENGMHAVEWHDQHGWPDPPTPGVGS